MAAMDEKGVLDHKASKMDIGECWDTILSKFNAHDDAECKKFTEKHKTFDCGEKKCPVTDISVDLATHTLNWLKKSTLSLSKTMSYNLHKYLHTSPKETFLESDIGPNKEWIKEIHWLDLSKRHYLSLRLWASVSCFKSLVVLICTCFCFLLTFHFFFSLVSYTFIPSLIPQLEVHLRSVVLNLHLLET